MDLVEKWECLPNSSTSTIAHTLPLRIEQDCSAVPAQKGLDYLTAKSTTVHWEMPLSSKQLWS